MSKKGVKPKSWNFQSEFTPSFKEKSFLPGIDLGTLFNQMEAAGVTHVDITFTEIVDWDMAPMRKYFHGVVVPAWTLELEKAYGRRFSAFETKDYLKAKHLGWNRDNPHTDQWWVIIGLNKPTETYEAYVKIRSVNGALKTPFEPNSTANLTPEEYMKFINACEADFLDTFNTMYSKKDKPIINEKKEYEQEPEFITEDFKDEGYENSGYDEESGY